MASLGQIAIGVDIPPVNSAKTNERAKTSRQQKASKGTVTYNNAVKIGKNALILSKEVYDILVVNYPTTAWIESYDKIIPYLRAARSRLWKVEDNNETEHLETDINDMISRLKKLRKSKRV